MNSLGEAIGELCKVILPIPEHYFLGNPESTICVCTLSSINLLKKFEKSEILEDIFIAGRLLSENKGIDSIIEFVNKNQKIKAIIVCGKEVSGHKAGHSLFELHKNGIDSNCRIINSTSPDPYLLASKSKVEYFQNKIDLVNLINETNFDKIIKTIREI
ncbi:MAG: tetrahydromethanopterin S-methyltransferase subunit A [Nitrosopumilus sp.]|nr:tetrahydromethanopterin S-methyltransferase subunit A [Nitrosopumilus sp.]NNL59501.1 tetrahydromethanopterin S-methyltransferase subunit A [Nitrosopumilus sp.]